MFSLLPVALCVHPSIVMKINSREWPFSSCKHHIVILFGVFKLSWFSPIQGFHVKSLCLYLLFSFVVSFICLLAGSGRLHIHIKVGLCWVGFCFLCSFYWHKRPTPSTLYPKCEHCLELGLEYISSTLTMYRQRELTEEK